MNGTLPIFDRYNVRVKTPATQFQYDMGQMEDGWRASVSLLELD